MDKLLRYQRNLGILTPDEQSRLLKSRVCVVGCGGLGGFLDPAWNADVYDQIIRQVAETTPGVGYASAENLVDRGDKLHFDTPSQYILGERYLAEYCRITGK